MDNIKHILYHFWDTNEKKILVGCIVLCFLPALLLLFSLILKGSKMDNVECISFIDQKNIFLGFFVFGFLPAALLLSDAAFRSKIPWLRNYGFKGKGFAFIVIILFLFILYVFLHTYRYFIGIDILSNNKEIKFIYLIPKKPLKVNYKQIEKYEFSLTRKGKSKSFGYLVIHLKGGRKHIGHVVDFADRNDLNKMNRVAELIDKSIL